VKRKYSDEERKERHKIARKKYYDKKRTSLKPRNKKYDNVNVNVEDCKKFSKEYHRQWRINNQDKVKASRDKYKQKNGV